MPSSVTSRASSNSDAERPEHVKKPLWKAFTTARQNRNPGILLPVVREQHAKPVHGGVQEGLATKIATLETTSLYLITSKAEEQADIVDLRNQLTSIQSDVEKLRTACNDLVKIVQYLTPNIYVYVFGVLAGGAVLGLQVANLCHADPRFTFSAAIVGQVAALVVAGFVVYSWFKTRPLAVNLAILPAPVTARNV